MARGQQCRGAWSGAFGTSNSRRWFERGTYPELKPFHLVRWEKRFESIAASSSSRTFALTVRTSRSR